MREIFLQMEAHPIGRWCLILGIPIALTLALLVFMPHLICLIEWSYERSGNSFADLHPGDAPYLYVGVLGIVVALVTVGITAYGVRSERRKQDTLKIILEARLSKDFQKQLLITERFFPIGEQADLDQFLSYDESDEYEEKIKAMAVIRVLNHYEFICSGIRDVNLDERIMKKNLRGALCGLVHDMQEIIFYYRDDPERGSKANFEHLIAIFLKWAKDDPKYADARQRFLG